jgi:hypothetical protein
MISFEEIIDKWLAENFNDYWVWSIPDEAYLEWPCRAYIISNDEVLFATIVNNCVVPTTQFKDISSKIMVSDPDFFEKLKHFMTKAATRHSSSKRKKHL